MNNTRNILVKLGMALYLHKKLASDAAKAVKAVRYLTRNGVLK